MNTELTFLCDSATDDRGKLHALGIGIDSVQGDALPFTHPRFIVVCVVGYSSVEAGNKRLEIRLLDPDAQDAITPIEQDITFASRQGVLDSKARIIIEVNSVTFRSLGPHAFHVVIDNHEMARLPLSVGQRSA